MNVVDLLPLGTPLGSLQPLVTVVKGEQVNRIELSQIRTEEYPYPVYNGGQNPSGYWKKWNREAGSTSISGGGNSAGFTQRVNERFWASGHNFSLDTKDPKKLDPDFLFYLLKSFEKKLMASRVGGFIPGISPKNLFEFEVPIPPLEKQLEIVRTIDAYESLAVLQEERVRLLKLQRDSLLNQIFSTEKNCVFWLGDQRFDTGEWKIVNFYDVWQKEKAPTIISSKDIRKNGDFPVIDQSQDFIAGYNDSRKTYKATRETPILYFGDHTTTVKLITFEFLSGGTGTHLFKASREFDPFFGFLGTLCHGPRPSGYSRHSKYLSRTRFKTPSLPDQQFIAKYFDNLDKQIKLEEERSRLLHLQKESLLNTIFHN